MFVIKINTGPHIDPLCNRNDHIHRACAPQVHNLGAYAHWNCDQGEGSLAEGTNTLQDPAGGRILQGCSNGGRRNRISAPAGSCKCLIRLLLNAGRLAVILAHTAAKNVRNLSTGAAAHTWTGTYIPPPAAHTRQRLPTISLHMHSHTKQRPPTIFHINL